MTAKRYRVKGSRSSHLAYNESYYTFCGRVISRPVRVLETTSNCIRCAKLSRQFFTQPKEKEHMETRDVQTYLGRIGWPLAVDGVNGPKTREAVSDFQLGYAFQSLDVDGIVGPLTAAAFEECIGRDTHCGDFFTFREFASKGNGWIKVHPQLIRRLDNARREVGPIRIVSGYRDPAHNTAAGGATNSQHLYGTAADIPGIGYDLARDLGFSGIGLSGTTAVHVDVRGEGPNNTTGGEPGSPTVWYY